ncbi:unnamed protein product [Ceratitis capitata]|uniref:(Mediterranean fruit fly) hypothetical protein n=1 Tax=Ceratitis capitata TaxID=7213 RepID=A0A811V9W2_CERCA|nr:unnamed protein product [Ceratitis capitata]
MAWSTEAGLIIDLDCVRNRWVFEKDTHRFSIAEEHVPRCAISSTNISITLIRLDKWTRVEPKSQSFEVITPATTATWVYHNNSSHQSNLSSERLRITLTSHRPLLNQQSFDFCFFYKYEVRHLKLTRFQYTCCGEVLLPLFTTKVQVFSAGAEQQRLWEDLREVLLHQKTWLFGCDEELFPPLC